MNVQSSWIAYWQNTQCLYFSSAKFEPAISNRVNIELANVRAVILTESLVLTTASQPQIAFRHYCHLAYVPVTVRKKLQYGVTITEIDFLGSLYTYPGVQKKCLRHQTDVYNVPLYLITETRRCIVFGLLAYWRSMKIEKSTNALTSS